MNLNAIPLVKVILVLNHVAFVCVVKMLVIFLYYIMAKCMIRKVIQVQFEAFSFFFHQEPVANG